MNFALEAKSATGNGASDRPSRPRPVHRTPELVYSEAVFRGLTRMGYSKASIAEMAGISVRRIAEFSSSRKAMTARMLGLIEQATGTTCGLIAAGYLEPGGGSLTQLMTVFAKGRIKVGATRDRTSAAKSRGAKRKVAARPSRARS